MAPRLVRRTAPFQRASALFLLAGLSAAACGGNYVPGDDGGSGGTDDDGSATGGVSASGGSPGSGGFPSSGGNPGAGGGIVGTGGCCAAIATCGEDTEIDIDLGCPEGAECYAHTFCCQTIYCMEAQAPCDAIPVCEEGENEVDECPDGWQCTQRARCGTVITCLNDDVCDPAVQPNRDYAGSSESDCEVVDYACPEHTTSFTDECGCGCEQPSTCPRWLDCTPGGQLDPLCGSTECPYTQRGL